MAIMFTNRIIPIHIKPFHVWISPIIAKSSLVNPARRDTIRSTTFGGLSEEEMERLKDGLGGDKRRKKNEE